MPNNDNMKVIKVQDQIYKPAGYERPEKPQKVPGTKDIPKWLNLKNLQFVTVVEKGDSGFIGMFKDRDGNLLRIDIKSDKKNRFYSPAAKISVAEAGTNKFRTVAFTESVKEKVLGVVEKKLPRGDIHLSFLQGIKHSPADRGKVKVELKIFKKDRFPSESSDTNSQKTIKQRQKEWEQEWERKVGG